jgi:HSP20 family protein
MTAKGLKKLVTRESPRHLDPFYDMEHWFEESWKRPFSLFGPSIWSDRRMVDRYEISPRVDLFEEGGEIVLNIDLPGVKKDDIKIDLSGNILTLSGEKKRKEKFMREDYCRCERSFGSFIRRFEMPGDLDVEKIKAHFEDGVLEVRIPIIESEKKHKKIAVH